MTTTDLTASPPDHHSQNLPRLFYSLQNFPRLLKTFSKQTLDMIDMSRFSVRCALYSLMYRQMDYNKRLSGFWIRNQIDFAGVSNAVYFTREVASYCVAHERHMRSISIIITARRTSGGLRDVWRDYPMVNVQEVRVVLFLSDECKHNSSNTDFTEPLTFTESTRR